MGKLTLAMAVLTLVAGLPSCSHRKTQTEQLTDILSDHLTRIGPGVTLDSVHILWRVPVTERLGSIINDTVYMREYNRIRAQMAGARLRNDKDSMEFYSDEIAIMKREIDSISKAIGQGDTTHSYGSLMSIDYFLRKAGGTASDSTLVYIDSAGVLRFTDYMDSSLARTTRFK